jgi:TolB protein
MRIALLFACALAAGCASADIAFPVTTDAGGCRLERVTDAGADDGHFQFHGPSVNGKLFVGWYRGDAKGAYLLDLKTGGRVVAEGLNNSGALSRDGASALVANALEDGTTEILERQLATGETRAIAPHPRHEFLATYSPDGKWILFNSYRTGKSDIYVIAREGGEPIRFTDFDGYDAHADFSPDMQTILFHRNIGAGDYDIYRIDFATKAAAPFITGAGEQSYPAWSPDGRFVAFASDAGEEASKTDIYLADSAGREIARLTHEPGYNTYPAWSGDGKYVYFNSERAGKRNVYRMRLDGEGACAR